MVVMGQVIAPYGVKGWIKIRTYSEAVENLSRYPSWWVAKNSDWIEKRVVESRVHGNMIVASLEQCSDRGAAESFIGYEIAVPRSSLPRNRKGEYYWVDLIGLKITNRQNLELGEVEGLLETGANAVLKVNGNRERLIPFVDDVIVEVDLKQRRIVVDWDADF